MGNQINTEDFYPRLRLAFIERKARAQGWIQRGDLVDAFGLSLAQASADLQGFVEMYPRALSYSLSRKRYEWVGGKRMLTQLPPPVKELDL